MQITPEELGRVLASFYNHIKDTSTAVSTKVTETNKEDVDNTAYPDMTIEDIITETINELEESAELDEDTMSKDTTVREFSNTENSVSALISKLESVDCYTLLGTPISIRIPNIENTIDGFIAKVTTSRKLLGVDTVNQEVTIIANLGCINDGDSVLEYIDTVGGLLRDEFRKVDDIGLYRTNEFVTPIGYDKIERLYQKVLEKYISATGYDSNYLYYLKDINASNILGIDKYSVIVEFTILIKHTNKDIKYEQH